MYVWIFLCLATVLANHAEAEEPDTDVYFAFGESNYDCSSTGNLICLGSAHKYIGNPSGSFYENPDGSFEGKLSLITEVDDSQDPPADEADNPPGIAGIAYYNQPVRMLDLSARKSATFSTSFAFAARSWNNTENMSQAALRSDSKPLDGMTFVISADNHTLGASNCRLGFFSGTINDHNSDDGRNNFKSIVVEFDNWRHTVKIWNDIDDNHVAFDFQNVTSVKQGRAGDVGVYLWKPSTVYAWVDYIAGTGAGTQQLELRISNSVSKPVEPFLSQNVSLFDVVDEFMWIGFSGSTGINHGNYYICNWTFHSSFGRDVKSSDGAASNIGKKVGIPLGIVTTIVTLLVVLICGAFCAKHRSKRGQWQLGRPRRNNHFNDLFLASMAEGYRFAFKELSVATGGFNERSILGKGGFGTVYRGVLAQSGMEIAVKKLKTESSQGEWEKSFVAEISIISQLRHRNLIKLLGWCTDRGHYLIVYELMPNGSLDNVLFGPDEKHPALSWSQRFNVIYGTAAGVDYLHRSWNQKVLHRDIKLSNIMLDHEWNAKLGDFGLARLVDHQRTPSTTGAAGTLGYMAPETFSGKFTEKTDVYAFGIVALEIATGRKCISLRLPEDEMVLVDWVWQRLSEGDELSVVDNRLSDYDRPCMETVLWIGLLCANPDPACRPPMRHVVQILAGDVDVPPLRLWSRTVRYVKAEESDIVEIRVRDSQLSSSTSSTQTLSTSSSSSSSSSTQTLTARSTT